MPDRAAAAQAFHRDWRMAELAGRPVGTVQDATFVDNRSTHSGGNGHVYEVRALTGGAEGHLSQCRDVRVALQECRQSESGAEFGRERNIDELRAHVGRLKNDASPRIDRTGAGDADTDERGTYLFRHVLAGPDAVSYTHLTLPTNREVYISMVDI